MVKRGHVGVEFEQRHLVAGVRTAILEFKRYTRALGEHLDRSHEVNALVLHEEAEHVSAGAAAEAVVDLALLVDVERGGLLLVERAQRLVGGTGALQVEAGADDVNDVVSEADVFQRALGNDGGHRCGRPLRRSGGPSGLLFAEHGEKTLAVISRFAWRPVPRAWQDRAQRGEVDRVWGERSG